MASEGFVIEDAEPIIQVNIPENIPENDAEKRPRRARVSAGEKSGGRRRVSKCENPDHRCDDDGNVIADHCIRWSHLPGNGRGPVQTRRGQLRATLTRAIRHIVVWGLILLSGFLFLRVVVPALWGHTGFGIGVIPVRDGVQHSVGANNGGTNAPNR
jgi:hypothetical protein